MTLADEAHIGNFVVLSPSSEQVVQASGCCAISAPSAADAAVLAPNCSAIAIAHNLQILVFGV